MTGFVSTSRMRHAAAAPVLALLLLQAGKAACAEGDAASDAQRPATSLQDEIAEMRARMAEMEVRHQNEMAALRAEYGDRWLTEHRAEEIRALVRDVIADSQARASLQGQGAAAGWKRHFYLASEDGNYKLQFRAQIQARWALSSRNLGTRADAAPGSPLSPENPAETSDNVWGFELRRIKIDFSGHIIDPSWTYEIQPIWIRGQDTGATNGSIENVFIQKAFGDGFSLRVGQYKVPFNREELITSTNQMVVERSLASEMLTPKFSQGLLADWQTEFFRLRGYFGDSMRANGSGITRAFSLGAGESLGTAAPLGNFVGGFNQPVGAFPVNYAVSTRAEWLAAGTWEQFRDIMGTPDEDFGVLLGGAYMAQSLRDLVATPTSNPMFSMWAATADLSLEFPGANIFAAAIYRRVNLLQSQAVRGGGSAQSMDQWSAMVQAGYFVTDDIELYTRYEYGNSDSDKYRTFAGTRNANGETLSILTLGVNWFPAGSRNRNIKWTTDFGVGFSPIVDWANSGADWQVDYTQRDGSGNDGQVVIRTQMQLLF